ncbi:phage antirepressor [Paenibacillus larvae]|uniref:Antirepressor n=8 Tax=root TaxID=1 RepID=A0A0K2CY14_9CAUD|nr:phage antirepressor [Paenibacillus larvae]YP_009193866.1 anti-repressor Ant [Paenibacillus phage Harrison]YP_009203243.1 anti-repressor Ant [Paenibacillus phage Fern]YP_009593450.1 anti-repressor Ant [Paenibacillus phage Willow]YP_009836521.1 anti-repressor Ant [Paenibacillus phage Tadhana]YP_009836658.1 anti-repressor Ant [Paenibacillus phage Likha]YP_009838675.1 anti-repressor Ant [Paenibacillus phage Yyerffej]ALA12614.1 antirepressor [Paenibacillus phage Paisley]QVV19446.1 antirepress
MNQLQVFNFTGKDVRVIMKDGQPWWLAKDICSVLDHSDVSMAVKRLDEDEKLTQTLFVSGQNRNVWFVNEPGLYSLILTSRKPEAKQFKRWVTHEVLPAIRKTGMYATDELLDNPDFLIQAATKLKEEREARKLLESQIEQDRPKVIFAEALETSKSSILIGELAKLLKQNGINVGQNRLFNWLRAEGYLGRKGDYRNLPTQKSMELGLFEIKTRTIANPDGSTRITKTTKVTGKGQVYFVNKFKQGETA